jgi:hypothetical protein
MASAHPRKTYRLGSLVRLTASNDRRSPYKANPGGSIELISAEANVLNVLWYRHFGSMRAPPNLRKVSAPAVKAFRPRLLPLAMSAPTAVLRGPTLLKRNLAIPRWPWNTPFSFGGFKVRVTA